MLFQESFEKGVEINKDMETEFVGSENMMSLPENNTAMRTLFGNHILLYLLYY